LSEAGLTCECAEENVVGEALVALQHSELKEMGMNSMGHRLLLLKAVYEVKLQQNVPIESFHYVPLCEWLRNERLVLFLIRQF